MLVLPGAIRGFTLALLVAGLTACGGTPRTIVATSLNFIEQERGTGPYRTRILVTSEFVRIDDGVDNNEFILFDRLAQILYSVNPMDARILVMQPGHPDAKSPVRLEHQVKRQDDKPPHVGGRPVKHYVLMTNGAVCYDLYAVEALLPDALQAMREFHETLAREQALSPAFTPDEFQSPCELANNVFAPARQLAHGFPIRYVDMNGRTRELADYRVGAEVSAALFELPASYRRMTLQEIRGR